MRSVLFIILVSIAIQACKRDVRIPSPGEPDINDTTKGRVWAEINGKNERFFVRTADYNETFNFYPNRGLKSFPIVKIEKTLNTQRVYKLAVDTNNAIIRMNAVFYTLWTDGDALCEVFGVIEADSLNNYVLITKQNNNYEEVFGTFNLTLIKTKDCQERHYSVDTLKIRKGYFHLYLK